MTTELQTSFFDLPYLEKIKLCLGWLHLDMRKNIIVAEDGSEKNINVVKITRKTLLSLLNDIRGNVIKLTSEIKYQIKVCIEKMRSVVNRRVKKIISKIEIQLI